MFKKNIFIALFCSLTITQINAAKTDPQSEAESLATASQIVNELAQKSATLTTQLKGKDASSFSDEELLALVKSVSSNYMNYANELSADDIKKVQLAENIIVDLLKKFKVSGFSFCMDSNGAFFVDNQDPKFTVVYKNDQGSFKNRTYQASIDSIGFKIQFALKFNLIFFVGTDLNFYDSKKTIELGRGIEFSLPVFTEITKRMGWNETTVTYTPEQVNTFAKLGITWPASKQCARVYLDPEITYVSFKNMPGALIMVSYALGLGSYFGASPLNYSLSYVKGGTLKPDFKQ